jgi:hypothetical protein
VFGDPIISNNWHSVIAPPHPSRADVPTKNLGNPP